MISAGLQGLRHKRSKYDPDYSESVQYQSAGKKILQNQPLACLYLKRMDTKKKEVVSVISRLFKIHSLHNVSQLKLEC